MPFLVGCPVCQARLSVPNASAGKAIRCASCRNPIMIPDPGPVAVESPAPPPVRSRPSARVETPEPERTRPRTRRANEDDEDDRPRPRKKRRPASSDRSPYLVLLLVGGGALALIVVACAGGAIWHLSSETQQPVPDGVASTSPPLTGLGEAPSRPLEPGGSPPSPAPGGQAGAAPTGPARAAGFDFEDPAGAFRVTFPSGPPFRQDAGQIMDEQMEFSKFLSKNISDEEIEQWKQWAKELAKDFDGYAWYTFADGRRYRVMITNLDRGPFAGMSPADLLDSHVGSYKQLGVRSVSSKRLVVNGGDCVQVEWRRPDGKSQVDRVFVAGKSMILLSVNATEAARVGVNRVSAADPPVVAFFDSFKSTWPLLPPREKSDTPPKGRRPKK